MPLMKGQTFAGYTIIRLVGSGGMGEVYLAQHPRLPRQDALKILRPDVSADEDYRQRFIREADLAATLWHPNIVRVNDRGDHDGQLWLAMDYVEGTDAARLLGDRYPNGMPAGEVAEIVTAIAGALDYAHAHGLLHRDVKPANILLADPVDGERRILLSDFGIARTTDDVSGLTATNMTMGTLPYASPEQLMGKTMDGRADQYSLAATAYHLLSGTTLFPESSPAAVIGSHLTTPPPPLASTRPELASLDPVLAVALAKDPAQRFARCKDFATAFTEATQSGGQSTSWAATMPAPVAGDAPTLPPEPDTDTGKPRRRRWTMVLAGAAATVIALTLAGIIGYFIQHAHQGASAPSATSSTSLPPTSPEPTASPNTPPPSSDSFPGATATPSSKPPRSPTAATSPLGNPSAAFCADNAAQLNRTSLEMGLDPATWASDPRNLARFGFSGAGDIDTLYHMVIDKGPPYVHSYFSNETGAIEWRCSSQ